MIRRSASLALGAVILSLLLHALGVDLFVDQTPDAPAADQNREVVAMGNAFEDVAETNADPVPPETAAEPDLPVETPPEPDRAPVPTSDARVASPDPQDGLSPDLGSAEAVQPEPAPAPEEEATPPVSPEAQRAAQPPEDPPVADSPATDRAETAAPAAPPDAAGAPAPQPPPAVAAPAVTPPVLPETPVTPAPDIATVAVPPVPSDPVDPEPSEQTVPDAESSPAGSRLAVATSVRPRAPTTRPAATSDDPPGGPDATSRPATIESPLALYQREGIDVFGGQARNSNAQGRGFQTGRSGGNADSTNYAGQVLVHLNRATPVRVSGRGTARVFFEINPDGTLAWVNVVDSTGSDAIDRAAVRQVRSASPFPTPPDGRAQRMSFVYRVQ